MTLSEVLLERAKANIAWDDKKFWHKLSLSSRAGTAAAIKSGIRAQLGAKGFDKSIAGLKAYSELCDKPEVRSFSVEEIEASFKDFPEGASDYIEPFVIPHERGGLMSDLHIGLHSKSAILKAIAGIKRINPEFIWLNGDVADVFSLSRHDKIPGKLSIVEEINQVKAFFVALRETFPKIPIYYKDGNHENRLLAFIIKKCPELLDLFGWSIYDVCALRDLGVIHIENNQISTFGRLHVLHGNESFLLGGGVSPARNSRMKAGNVDLVIGHVHRISSDIFRGLDGKITRAYSVGCLCDYFPNYTGAANSWTHGYGIMERSGMDYHFQNIEILK